MASVTISSSNTSSRYETVIDSASSDALTVSGSNVGVKAEGIIATGSNHSAILVTGDSVSITATLIHSGSYDSIIANSTSGNVSVTAERMSAFANCIETNGGSPTVCVRANEIESGEGINFESTGGSVFIDCNRLVIPLADLVNSSATTAELNIRANYIKCNGISGTTGLTIRITDAIIDSAITIDAGTLELRNCVCLGIVAQSSTGVIRYDGQTQFRSTPTGTVTEVGPILEVKEKTDLITSGGVVNTSNPVNANGLITRPIIIGDDYKASVGNAFTWDITARTGFVVATSTCRFGGASDSTSTTWNVTGTVSDNGDGTWELSFDMPKATTSALEAGAYKWSVEIANAGGDEVTEVWSPSASRLVEVRSKQT